MCLAMPYKPRDIEHTLQYKFGFTPAKQRSTDHRWYELQFPGLPVIATKVSHGKKEIVPAIEAKIARQLRVRRPFFMGMVRCDHELDDYERQVREDPYPPWHIRF